MLPHNPPLSHWRAPSPSHTPREADEETASGMCRATCHLRARAHALTRQRKLRGAPISAKVLGSSTGDAHEHALRDTLITTIAGMPTITVNPKAARAITSTIETIDATTRGGGVGDALCGVPPESMRQSR